MGAVNLAKMMEKNEDYERCKIFGNGDEKGKCERMRRGKCERMSRESSIGG